MATDQIIKQIASIKQSDPQNLMARHFDSDYFESLDKALQQQLTKIIKTGIKNPNSSMGAYAMNPQDYDTFSQILDPMIRDYHGITDGTKIAQKHDWDTSITSCDLGAIDQRLRDVSMRVRVARNVSTFPLPGAMSKEQRIDFENIAAKAFVKLAKNPNFGGTYLSITPNSPYEIDADEYDRRVQAHQMFKDMSADPYLNSAGISSDWPYGRGMYISKDEDFLVWIGEEDHLRIMAMQRGGNLNNLFKRLHDGFEILSDLLPEFAISPTYGSISSCPSNLGAGMRASLHIKLPNLTSNGSDLTRLEKETKQLNLAVRGAGGEHSGAGEGGLVDISPSARLGVTEMEIMQRLYNGVAKLWTMEVGSSN
jgi:creatine kinase